MSNQGRNRSRKLENRQWSGSRAFIVGGGPSLRDFDWSLLREQNHVIVINRAYREAPEADIFFTEDLRFIERYAPLDDWKKFLGLKVYHCLDKSFERPALAADPDLYIIHKQHEDKRWSLNLEDGLSYSSNSGVGAINLACILDADPIYLLGFDCRSDGKLTTNYHADYDQDWRTGAHQYESFASDFTHWVALHTRDRQIVNVINPAFPSALKCWTTMPFDEVPWSLP